MHDMRVFAFVLAATTFEAAGDAVIRISLNHGSTAYRIIFFTVGSALLSLYGTSLNLAPVEFAEVTGLYIAMLVVMFQIANFIFFRTAPTGGVLAGGSLVIVGGLLMYFLK
jgi:small multidrug resistance family-3 protein